MRKGSSDAAALDLEIHDVAVLAARENHALAEGVAALMVDQTGVEQTDPTNNLGRRDDAAGFRRGAYPMPNSSIRAGSRSPRLCEVLHRFRMPVELELIEGRRFFQHGVVVRRGNVPLEEGETFGGGNHPLATAAARCATQRISRLSA